MTSLTSIVSLAARAVPGTNANRLLVLIYHRVRPEPSQISASAMHRSWFDWQMGLVARYCTPISMHEGLSRMREGTLPARSVAVTFDDGYADNAEVALPILLRHGVQSTFFVATGFLNGGRMWNDSITEAIRRARCSQLDLQSVGLGHVTLGPESTRGEIIQSIIKTVKHLSPSDRQERVERLCRTIGAELPTDLMMTSAQVRKLSDAGMEIGAHTVTHPIMRLLSDADSKREVTECRAALENITGRPVRSFAYPNGRPGDDYTDRDRDIISSLGFDYAASTTSGVATARSDVYQLPRFTPWDPQPHRWLSRLLLAFNRPA